MYVDDMYVDDIMVPCFREHKEFVLSGIHFDTILIDKYKTFYVCKWTYERFKINFVFII